MARRVSAKVRELVAARSGGVCEKCGTQKATEQHHRTGRGMGSSRAEWINQPSNLLHLCSSCHEDVTNTRGQRVFMETCGWIVPRNGTVKPAEVPVVLHHGLVLLDDAGGYREAL